MAVSSRSVIIKAVSLSRELREIMVSVKYASINCFIKNHGLVQFMVRGILHQMNQEDAMQDRELSWRVRIYSGVMRPTKM